MLLAVYANNLYGESGVFGFARDFLIYGSEPGPLFYHYLQDQGVFQSRIFTLNLAPNPEQSFVEFNTYNIDKYGKSGIVLELDVEETFFWQHTVEGIRVGELGISASRVSSQ